jgi:hypothetical protein
MEPFYITIKFSGNENYRLLVTLKYENDNSERYEVRAKNHTFLLDCNRPEMAKKKLEHLQWEWKLVAGNCPGLFFREITNEIRRTVSWIRKH